MATTGIFTLESAVGELGGFFRFFEAIAAMGQCCRRVGTGSQMKARAMRPIEIVSPN